MVKFATKGVENNLVPFSEYRITGGHYMGVGVL
jgi:hypothetical protein